MLPLRTLCIAKLTNLLLSGFQKPLKRLMHIPIAYDTGWTLSKWTQVIQSLFSTSIYHPPTFCVGVWLRETRLHKEDTLYHLHPYKSRPGHTTTLTFSVTVSERWFSLIMGIVLA